MSYQNDGKNIVAAMYAGQNDIAEEWNIGGRDYSTVSAVWPPRFRGLA